MVNTYLKAGVLPLRRDVSGGFTVDVRLSVDGTSLWRLGLEVSTLSFAEPGVCSNHRLVHPVGICIGHESRPILTALMGCFRPLTHTKLVPTWQGVVTCQLHLCADHMRRSRLGQCDGPSCTLPHRHMCPFCDGTPEETRAGLTYTPAFRLLTVDRALGWPILRSPPDQLHAVSSVVKWALRHTPETILATSS